MINVSGYVAINRLVLSYNYATRRLSDLKSEVDTDRFVTKLNRGVSRVLWKIWALFGIFDGVALRHPWSAAKRSMHTFRSLFVILSNDFERHPWPPIGLNFTREKSRVTRDEVTRVLPGHGGGWLALGSRETFPEFAHHAPFPESASICARECNETSRRER